MYVHIYTYTYVDKDIYIYIMYFRIAGTTLLRSVSAGTGLWLVLDSTWDVRRSSVAIGLACNSRPKTIGSQTSWSDNARVVAAAHFAF